MILTWIIKEKNYRSDSLVKQKDNIPTMVENQQSVAA